MSPTPCRVRCSIPRASPQERVSAHRRSSGIRRATADVNPASSYGDPRGRESPASWRACSDARVYLARSSVIDEARQ